MIRISLPIGFVGAAVVAGLVIFGTSGAGQKQSVEPEASGLALWPEIQSAVPHDPSIEARIANMLAAMTLEEKIGQMMQVEIQQITPQDIRDYHLGSVLNGGGSLPGRNKYATPADWLALADQFYDASMDTRDGKVAIPIIWGSDAVHGHNNVIGATIFPHNIGLGAANNPDLIREIGTVTAREMRVTGIDWTFAPTLAVAQNDRWGRTYESYSENPDIVRAYGGAMVRGLQGDASAASFLRGDHVVATAKHFVGDGGTFGGDDQGNAILSEAELARIHAAGYATALGAGAQAVMVSFSSWNGEKVHGSRYLLTDVLKGRMGFDGLVLSDWNGHGQIPGCTNANCPIAVNAGLDLYMVIEDWKALYTNTLNQVRKGVIPLARIDDAVARILRVKLRAGLFEKGRPSSRGIAGENGIIGSAAHRDVARRAVRQSLVLLKNTDGVLPLNPKAHILVTGDGADNIGKQTGGWTISWQGTGNSKADFPGGTSIFDGVKDAVERAGGSVELSADGSFEKKPDVAIVVFGEEPYAEGQGDLDTLEFQPGDKRALALLTSLKQQDIPVVSVFLSGRPLWVNPEINQSDAFVAAWLPGSEGIGVADILVAGPDGKPRYDFQGTLPFSWPKTPLQDKLNPHHSGYDPLFKLGYGLRYTSTETGPSAPLEEDVEGVASATQTSLDLYQGRPRAPWLVLLVDDGGQAQLSGAYAALASGSATLEVSDKDVQGDAMRLSVQDGHEVLLQLGSGPVMDWRWAIAAGAAFSFDVRVDALQDAAWLEIGCGEGCTYRQDLSAVLKGHAGSGWARISVPLAVLTATNPSAVATIATPFQLRVRGGATIDIANIGLAPALSEQD